MGRIDDWFVVFSDPNGGVLVGHAPEDSALFSLLAHVAFADQQIDDSEFAVLRRLFPFSRGLFEGGRHGRRGLLGVGGTDEQ